MAVMRDRGGFVQRVGVERFEVALIGVTQCLCCDRGDSQKNRSAGEGGDECRKQGSTHGHTGHFHNRSAPARQDSRVCCQSLKAAQATFLLGQDRFRAIDAG